MQQSSNPGDSFSAFAASVREEVETMLGVLPEALLRQWETSPVPRPSEDTTERSSGGAPSRPVESVVFDGRRLAVREAVREAFLALRRVQRASADLRRAVSRFDDDGGPHA